MFVYTTLVPWQPTHILSVLDVALVLHLYQGNSAYRYTNTCLFGKICSKMSDAVSIVVANDVF